MKPLLKYGNGNDEDAVNQSMGVVEDCLRFGHGFDSPPFG